MSVHAYPLTSFPNEAVCEDRLKAEVVAALPGRTLRGIRVQIPADPEAPGSCEFVFEEELDGVEVATLSSVVAVHSGDPVTRLKFHASSTLADLEKTLASSEWAVLGGVVTTPEFFCSVGSILARVVGSYRAVETGAELRLVEDGTRVLGTFQIPDSADAWTKMQWFSSDVPLAGTHEYTLEGRLNGASSASVRFVSMSLLEVC